jgi:hypothetical protein
MWVSAGGRLAGGTFYRWDVLYEDRENTIGQKPKARGQIFHGGKQKVKNPLRLCSLSDWAERISSQMCKHTVLMFIIVKLFVYATLQI